jgi:hypothetical protein
MAACLALAADGKFKAGIELSQLSSINETLGRLERGEVASRVVLDFAGTKQATNAEDAAAPRRARDDDGYHIVTQGLRSSHSPVG